MPLNTNIALGVQTPQFESPMKMAMIASQLQQADQANQLNQMRMAEYTRETQNKNALAAAYAQSFDPTSGKLDYNKLTGLLASGGQGTQIPAILKQRTEEERAARKADANRRRSESLKGRKTWNAGQVGTYTRSVYKVTYKDGSVKVGSRIELGLTEMAISYMRRDNCGSRKYNIKCIEKIDNPIVKD